MRLGRPFRTRFRCGSPPEGLTCATCSDSRTHYAKGMRSQPCGCSHSSWACGFRSLSLPSRGSFHLSLAVLVRYRSSPSVQPWGVGPPDSDWVSRVPPYLGSRWGGRGFRVPGFHRLWPAFPGRSPTPLQFHIGVPQPRPASRAVWAPARSLAATCAITVVFSSSGY